MVRARAIAGTLGLDMKICDVEYRGDGRKATFYYTAEGRVDFRELVRSYARELQVKIEISQIGARQESARIGGIGSCGRELCCSTWLTDFKSVNTHAARYQNLSINQAKLSGQCGRLKCCLNYELDTYMEAIEEFPQEVDILRFQGGSASLIKMDIFKRLLYYSVEVERSRNTVMALSLDRVKVIKDMNLKGQLPEFLQDPDIVPEEEKLDFAGDSGDIELPDYKKKSNRKKNKPGQRRDGAQASGRQQREPRTDQPQRRDQPRRQDRSPRSDQPQPKRETQQPGVTQGPRPPGDPNAPRQEDGRQAQGGGQRRNKNRNRNRNRGPRPDRGDKPPKDNPTS
jgi:hypothetical protein